MVLSTHMQYIIEFRKGFNKVFTKFFHANYRSSYNNHPYYQQNKWPNLSLKCTTTFSKINIKDLV